MASTSTSRPRPWTRTGSRHLHSLKTGRLIRASIEMALAMLGGVTEASREPFRRFATQIGLLFQIVDDIPRRDREATKNLGSPRAATSVTER